MRARPNEGISRQLREREQRLQQDLARVKGLRQVVRDRITGKTRAQVYVKMWLEQLDPPELRHEAEIRGFRWEAFATREQAIDTLQAAIFAGVVAEPTHASSLTAPAGEDDDGQRHLPFAAPFWHD